MWQLTKNDVRFHVTTSPRRRYFNTTGPCNPEKHYMLPPTERLQGAQLDRYINDELYWVLHAPRQTGKTTFLQTWMREINASGKVVAVYVSIERTRASSDPKDVMAFLQRITNGGGHIDREYAVGRGRLDLCVEYENKQYVIEIKLLRDYDSFETVREKGLQQITEYRAKFASETPAYLIIFDRRSPEKQLPWEERVYWKTENSINILGC